MSEDTTETTTIDSDDRNDPKTQGPKRISIPFDKIGELAAGIPQYDKASFLVIGHRRGVRIALPKTNGVSRAYFYGLGDYTLIPTNDAITVFTTDERKANRRGGIMAEVNFELGVEAAVEALTALIAVVRTADAPAAKGLKEPRKPRKSKAVAEKPDDNEQPTQ